MRRTFQTDQVVAHLTASDNVLVAQEQTGARGDGLTVDDALELVGLSDVASVPASRLTLAQRRLLEIARAAVGRPRVLLLDEPGAGLDSSEAQALARMLTAIAERTGALTILIDHDIELVRATCVELAVLDFGRVIATGPTAEVLADRSVRRAYLGEVDV